MNALPQIDLETSISRLRDAALRIKAERDAMEAVLRDIANGSDMMLTSPTLSGAFKSYVLEVRRVARDGLGAT